MKLWLATTNAHGYGLCINELVYVDNSKRYILYVGLVQDSLDI